MIKKGEKMPKKKPVEDEEEEGISGEEQAGYYADYSTAGHPA
jgi:hypothetical protein